MIRGPDTEPAPAPAPSSAPDAAAVVAAVLLVLGAILLALVLTRPSDGPAPEAADPEPAAQTERYVVRAGDTLESIALTFGVTVDELRHWNRERYPGLLPGMTPTVGIELATSGPPPPVAVPTVAPARIGPYDVPQIDAGDLPASERVLVSFYEVTGSTHNDIGFSIESNGPHSDWLAGNASAHVDVTIFYDFTFDRTDDGCTVVPTAAEPIHLVYEVVLPRWTPPEGVAGRTVEWWTAMITDLVRHEGGHIEIYEAYRDDLNRAVRDGTCATVEADLDALFLALDRANCEFDLAEYGNALGLSMESCLAN